MSEHEVKAISKSKKLGDLKYGHPTQYSGNPIMVKGNQCARADRMSAESHRRRCRGGLKACGVRAKLARGEMDRKMTKIGRKRDRARLRETVAREAREIQEIGRKNSEDVFRRLIEIARLSPNETAAIAAAQLVMDRTYGKANQTNINAHVDANGPASAISEKELNTRLAEALKRVEAITGRAPEAPESKKQLVDLRKLHRDPNGTPLN